MQQLSTPVTDVGLISVLSGHDELVRIGHFCRFNYVFFRSIFNAEGDIIEKSIVKKNGFLVHVTHFGA